MSYYILIGVWVFFLIPAIAMRGPKVLLWPAIIGGILASLYEAYMSLIWSKTVIAPIRVDAFLVIWCLFCLYGIGLAGILVCARDSSAQRKVIGFVAAIPVVLAIGYVAWSLWTLGQETAAATS